MMLNITEEQSVNGAFILISQGASAAKSLYSWLEKRKSNQLKDADIQVQKQATELHSDACSYYRGGYVNNANTAEMTSLINDLRGTEFTRADGNFIFLGDKSDLSYFWKKNERNESLVLERSCIDSIEDPSIRRGTLSAVTQAKEKGFLTFDGNAYALTEKGKEAILDPGFIANRLKGEEVFFEKAWQGLKEQSEKLYVFTEAGKEPTEFYVMGTIKDGQGGEQMKLISDTKEEIMLPNEARGVIAFEDKKIGEEFIKQNPDKAEQMQKLVEMQRTAKEKELYPTENYANTYIESENGYLVTLNNGETLELPKEDVIKLEDGSIKADIYYDKQYTLHVKDQKTTINGEGVKEQLAKNATKAAANTNATATTVNTVANTAANTIDGAATAYPPAKAVTASVNVVYKIAQGASTTASSVGSVSQKI